MPCKNTHTHIQNEKFTNTRHKLGGEGYLKKKVNSLEHTAIGTASDFLVNEIPHIGHRGRFRISEFGQNGIAQLVAIGVFARWKFNLRQKCFAQFRVERIDMRSLKVVLNCFHRLIEPLLPQLLIVLGVEEGIRINH